MELYIDIAHKELTMNVISEIPNNIDVTYHTQLGVGMSVSSYCVKPGRCKYCVVNCKYARDSNPPTDSVLYRIIILCKNYRLPSFLEEIF